MTEKLSLDELLGMWNGIRVFGKDNGLLGYAVYYGFSGQIKIEIGIKESNDLPRCFIKAYDNTNKEISYFSSIKRDSQEYIKILDAHIDAQVKERNRNLKKKK